MINFIIFSLVFLSSLVISILVFNLYDVKPSKRFMFFKLSNKVKNKPDLKNKSLAYFISRPSLRSDFRDILNLYVLPDVTGGFYYEIYNYNGAVISNVELSDKEFLKFGIKIKKKLPDFKNCFLIEVSSKANLMDFLDVNKDRVDAVLNDFISDSIKKIFLDNGIEIKNIIDCSYKYSSYNTQCIFEIRYDIIDKENLSKKKIRNDLFEKIEILESLINNDLNFLITKKVDFKSSFLNLENQLKNKYNENVFLEYMSKLNIENYHLFNTLYFDLLKICKNKIGLDLKSLNEDSKKRILDLFDIVSSSLEKALDFKVFENNEKFDFEKSVSTLLNISKKLLKKE